MNIVELDCSDCSGWKTALKEAEESKRTVRDFIIITIDKDNGVHMRKSDRVLPLISAMHLVKNEMLDNEVNRQNYELIDNNYVPIGEE